VWRFMGRGPWPGDGSCFFFSPLGHDIRNVFGIRKYLGPSGQQNGGDGLDGNGSKALPCFSLKRADGLLVPTGNALLKFERV